jgi:hypothetical protein
VGHEIGFRLLSHRQSDYTDELIVIRIVGTEIFLSDGLWDEDGASRAGLLLRAGSMLGEEKNRSGVNGRLFLLEVLQADGTYSIM